MRRSMRRPPDDSTEKSLLAGSAHGFGPAVVPALTIVWHPDLERVGEVCPLSLGAGERVELARLAPLFCPAGRRRRAGGWSTSTSADRRRRCGLRWIRAGQLQLLPGETEVPTEVDGVALDRPSTITPSELDGGVILLVARRIVLCLHRTPLPIVRGPQLGLVGGGEGMERVRQLVRRVADLQVPVLVRGETGSGKEMVARALVESGAAGGRAAGVGEHGGRLADHRGGRAVRARKGGLHGGHHRPGRLLRQTPRAGLCSWTRSG